MDANTEMTDMLELSDKIFKTAMEDALMSNYEHPWNRWKYKNLSKEIEVIKITKWKIENETTEEKSSVDGLNGRMERTEERISELENRIIELTNLNSGEIDWKKKQTNKQNLGDLWDYANTFNIHIIRTPEEKKETCLAKHSKK